MLAVFAMQGNQPTNKQKVPCISKLSTNSYILVLPNISNMQNPKGFWLGLFLDSQNNSIFNTAHFHQSDVCQVYCGNRSKAAIANQQIKKKNAAYKEKHTRGPTGLKNMTTCL